MNLNEVTFCAVDIEASAPVPLNGEICEIGAYRWNAQENSSFHSLIKPSEPMSDFIIGIHGITNEMVADAPSIEDKIGPFHEFLGKSVFVAHHAPFDVGFLAWEFERAGLPLPDTPILCTSLLSIKLFPELANHRLKTLVEHFQLKQDNPHRAFDDCLCCFEVLQHCFAKLPEPTLQAAVATQKYSMRWQDFSIKALRVNPVFDELIEAILQKRVIELSYGGGKGQGKQRLVDPIGIVRNPDGDYLMAFCQKDEKRKRYYLNKIKGIVPQ